MNEVPSRQGPMIAISLEVFADLVKAREAIDKIFLDIADANLSACENDE